MSELKDRVQHILDVRKWTQRELSRHAGLDESHVGAIVRGEVKSPQGRTLQAIAEGSGFSLTWLQMEVGNEQPYEAPTDARDQLYPSRTMAAEAARLIHVPEEAIARVVALNEEHERDPGTEYWFERMRAEARKR